MTTGGSRARQIAEKLGASNPTKFETMKGVWDNKGFRQVVESRGAKKPKLAKGYTLRHNHGQAVPAPKPREPKWLIEPIVPNPRYENPAHVRSKRKGSSSRRSKSSHQSLRARRRAATKTKTATPRGSKSRGGTSNSGGKK